MGYFEDKTELKFQIYQINKNIERLVKHGYEDGPKYQKLIKLQDFLYKKLYNLEGQNEE